MASTFPVPQLEEEKSQRALYSSPPQELYESSKSSPATSEVQWYI
jgi:hypothetical protein